MGYKKLAISLFLICSWGSSTLAYDDRIHDNIGEYKRYLRNRIEDFYKRINDIDRQNTARERGENETRKERKKLAEEAERYRKEYILSKRHDLPVDPMNWIRELKERQAVYEKSRQEFVKKRNEIKMATQGLSLPESEEYDIMTSEEESE
ncbi:MAG: hypothetical protein A2Z20_09525 [Bdellovibrionales bacterium RBG_16_40_8]|nr:MAG: hypothetical protein A2Z20_09525 [Bdellovibrionales bacterium RBG_16_40_8]